MPCDLRFSHAGRDRSYPPRTSGSRCRADPARMRVTSLEGASRQSDRPRSYADGAGQVAAQSTPVDRERPPDAGATGTRRARPVRMTVLGRGIDGRQLGRWVRYVLGHHEPRWQAPAGARGSSGVTLVVIDSVGRVRESAPSRGEHHVGTITTSDGTEIFYKDWGSGQPIVFSHGWPLSADDWGHADAVFPPARLSRRRP